MRAWWAMLVLGCDAPTIGVATRDTSVDSVVEDVAKECPPVLGPDNALCRGSNDEDDDCIPDACDDCPNVAQDTPIRANGQMSTGRSCTHTVKPFDTVTRRVFFESFADVAAWREIGPPLAPAESLRVVDGRAHFGYSGQRVVWADATSTGADVVATAVFASLARVGIVLRFSATEKTGYVCMAAGASLLLGRIRCTDTFGTTCNFEPVKTATGAFAEKDLPTPTLGERVVVRAAITTTAAGATIACQAFKAPTTAAEVALTLRLLDAEDWTLSVVLPAPIHASGAVGLYSDKGVAVVESLDVLTSP